MAGHDRGQPAPDRRARPRDRRVRTRAAPARRRSPLRPSTLHRARDRLGSRLNHCRRTRRHQPLPKAAQAHRLQRPLPPLPPIRRARPTRPAQQAGPAVPALGARRSSHPRLHPPRLPRPLPAHESADRQAARRQGRPDRPRPPPHRRVSFTTRRRSLMLVAEMLDHLDLEPRLQHMPHQISQKAALPGQSETIRAGLSNELLGLLPYRPRSGHRDELATRPPGPAVTHFLRHPCAPSCRRPQPAAGRPDQLHRVSDRPAHGPRLQVLPNHADERPVHAGESVDQLPRLIELEVFGIPSQGRENDVGHGVRG